MGTGVEGESGKGAGGLLEKDAKDPIVSELLSSEENAECVECLRKVLLEIDLTEDRPWRKERGGNDFFNYDLTERTFREYIRGQIM